MQLEDMYPAQWASYLHPLHGQRAPVASPGKQPKFPNWTELPTILSGYSSAEIFDGIREVLHEGDNVGLIIPDSVVVFDCDEPGRSAEVMAAFPDAPAQATQSGGVHIFFRLKPGERVSNAVRITLAGAKGDIRAAGGQVVVWPSWGIKGEYKWVRPLPPSFDDLPLRPEELSGRLSTRASSAVKRDHGSMPPIPDKPPTGSAVRFLEPFDMELCARLREGLPVGEVGNRDNALMRAVGAILQYGDTTDPKDPFKLLAYSVANDGSDGAPTPASLWSKCKRLADRQAVEVDEQNSLRQALLAKKRARAEEIAGKENLPLEELQRRLVCYSQKEFFVYDEEKGSYSPYSVGPIGVYERLQRLCPTLIEGIPLTGATGGPKGAAAIIALCGSPVSSIVAEAGLRGTRYDNNLTLTFGVWGVREDLKPTYHKEIAEWLTLLGGDHPDKLLDWLATITDNHSPSCALYLRGPKQCGKSLLVAGVSKLWGTPALPYRRAISRFNDGLLHTPLVVLDEGLDVDQSSSTFREFVASSELTVEAKFKTPMVMHGAPRIIITSNNDDALRLRDEIGVDDVQAITDRIGWIEVSPDSARWLAEHGGRMGGVHRWVELDMLAEHVLWLRDNHGVIPGDRFLVHGWDHPKLQQLPGRQTITGDVLVTLAYYIMDRIEGKPVPGSYGIVPGGNVLYVNIPALILYWEMAGTRLSKRPSQSSLAKALGTVSLGSRQIIGSDGKRLRVWEVDVKKMLAKAEEVGIGDPEQFQKFLQSEE